MDLVVRWRGANFAFWVVLGGSSFSPALAEPDLAIEPGRSVSIEYSIRLDDGRTVASNVGREPLTFRPGEQEILPAVEEQLQGLRADDSKEITISVDDAYGPVDPAAFMRVMPALVPPDSRTVGALLIAQDSEGRPRPVRVHDVRDGEIVIDFNHPLAGETLHVKIRVISVQ